MYFEQAEVDDDVLRLRAAGRALTHSAASWWEGERARPANDALKIDTWAKFVAALRKRFEPQDLPSFSRAQLTKLAAKGMTNVAAYTEQFQDINSLIVSMEEADRIHYYASGLPPHIRAVLANKVDSLLTLQQNIEAAIRAETSRTNSGVAAPGGASDHSSRSGWQNRSRGAAAALNQIEGSDDEGEQPSAPATSALETTLMRMEAQIKALHANQKRGAGLSGGGSQDRRGRTRMPRTEGLSNELAQARIQKRLCINCGKAGHMKFECKNAADITTQPPSN